MNRAARRLSRRRIGGLAGMSLVATTGLLGVYLGNPRMPRAYAATTCTVTTSADSGVGSLRQALLDHDAVDSDCSTIDFAADISTITLSSNLPTVTGSSLTITGPGSSALTVDLNSKSGIRMNNSTAGQTLSISGLILTGGNSAGYLGGAVYARHTNVTISDVSFTNNTSGGLNGGAVAVFHGQLDVTNSTFTSNTGGNGAATWSSYGAVNITGSTFTSNTSSGSGGAVSVTDAGQVNIASSAFIGNSAPGDYNNGGAVGVSSNDANVSLNVSYSTFSGNHCGSDGGALFVSNMPATVTNSTFVGNWNTYGRAQGGAIGAQNLTVNFTTFYGNSTNNSSYPGTIDASETYTLSNSIVHQTDTGLALGGGGGSSATFSFFNSSSALTNNSGAGLIFADTPGVAPLNLGALADNGGSTMTMLPGAGSPVIGAANPASTTPALDQRGYTRSSPSSMGAVESNGVRPVADTSQLPPSWFQATMRASSTEPCPSGSNPSWAAWPNQGTGGWTCEKTTWWDVNKGVSGGWVTTPGLRSLKHHAPKAHLPR